MNSTKIEDSNTVAIINYVYGFNNSIILLQSSYFVTSSSSIRVSLIMYHHAEILLNMWF